MSLDDRKAQIHLTPDERREMLRAFADRMLLKISAMDDPKDMPSVEKAVRTAAAIERIYSRCDRAERQKRDNTPDRHKIEAERAVNAVAAIKARVSLANTMKWGEERRPDLGQWWEAAQNLTQDPPRSAAKTAALRIEPAQPSQTAPTREAPAAFSNRVTSPSDPKVTYVDLTDDIEAFRAELALQRREAAKSAQVPRPPFRGPP